MSNLNPTTTSDSRRRGFLPRLADLAYSRRRAVLAAWVVALVAAFGAAGQLAGEWSADYSTPGSESKAASERLRDALPGHSSSTVDVVWKAPDARSPRIQQRVDGFLARAQRLEGIGDGVRASAAQVSDDRRIALVRLPLTTDRFDDVPTATGVRLIALAERTSGRGLRVELGGLVIQDAQSQELSSEVVGLLIATVVLLLSFGTLVATGMPLATALFGLGISSATIGVLAAMMDVPDWAPSVAAMIGIGVGIDYALLVVTRFRAALATGAEPRAATVEAVSTAGRSVLVAGSTVVISLLGLFLVGLTYLYGVALSAILAVLVAMAAAVTLLPALLAFTGRSINRLRIPGGSRGGAGSATYAARWGRAVQRRPWTATLVAGAVLLALAAPVTGLRLGFPDAGNDREGTTTRAAYELTTEGFGPGAAGPLMVVTRLVTRGDRARLAELRRNLAEQPGVASVGRPQLDRRGRTALVHVLPRTGPQAAATADLLHRVRGETGRSGLDVLVGGSTAAFVDQSESTLDRLPVFVGGVVGLSFLLLLFAFRAPLVALKAGVMNLFSIAAAYGLVALVADGGFAGQLVGIDSATPVPPFIPVMMFAILFGLSMDYEVFLLSRVREELLAGRDARGAVTAGLAATARVITAAAAIMVAVFGAFVLSDDVFLKLIGVGLSAAILIDATIVRMVLVPAVLQLLGDRGWWVPRWLDRALPQVEPEPEPAAAAAR